MPFEQLCECVHTAVHFVPPDNISLLIQEKGGEHRGGWGEGVCFLWGDVKMHKW